MYRVHYVHGTFTLYKRCSEQRFDTMASPPARRKIISVSGRVTRAD